MPKEAIKKPQCCQKVPLLKFIAILVVQPRFLWCLYEPTSQDVEHPVALFFAYLDPGIGNANNAVFPN